ncbi:hypothetical protein B0F90DRAFT_1669789 [Multifurca ochricompacta]|uniref:N-acetyltransferase domain-containing protein n=1 Tax=Multifurca ochricompacta TaxID=376703 RepID=A0AAD4LZK2_9AGAM|nr:hypothetical protein B0F90DRAFT_1669789 [Multifurca ochricompacta]
MTDCLKAQRHKRALPTHTFFRCFGGAQGGRGGGRGKVAPPRAPSSLFPTFSGNVNSSPGLKKKTEEAHKDRSGNLFWGAVFQRSLDLMEDEGEKRGKWQHYQPPRLRLLRQQNQQQVKRFLNPVSLSIAFSETDKEFAIHRPTPHLCGHPKRPGTTCRASSVLPRIAPDDLSSTPHAPDASLSSRYHPNIRQTRGLYRSNFTRDHLRLNHLTFGCSSSPVEVHVLALGVLPAYRRHGLATRLLHTATTTLRSLAATAPQVPSALVTPRTGTRVFADVVRTDGGARAFWKHVGMQEEEGSREPWATVGWRDAVSVAGSVLSAA